MDDQDEVAQIEQPRKTVLANIGVNGADVARPAWASKAVLELLAFSTRALVGSAAFIVVFAPAYGLAALMSALHRNNIVPEALSLIATGVEYMILAVDLFTLTLFMIGEGLQSWRRFKVELGKAR